MYSIIKKTKNLATLVFFLNAIKVLDFYIKNIVVFNRKYIAKITNPITKPQFWTIIKLIYTGIK